MACYQRNQLQQRENLLAAVVTHSSRNAPKYIRVTKSPQRRKSPRKSRLETLLPIKVTKQEPVYEESQSYDTSVLNELPSSIKESVIRDVEYKEKIKKFDLVSMRDKLAQKLENKKCQ